MSEPITVKVGRHTVRLSNLDKVMYPATGFTKGQCLEYYTRLADTVLPHVRSRPLVMARYPDGYGGPMFYQKRCPEKKPEWVHTAHMESDAEKGDINFCVVDDLASLAWLVNLAAFELHTLLCRADDVHTPTLIAFDLDPGPGADLVDCSRVAIQLRDLCEEVGLKSFPKSSGKKGMHLNVPLNSPTTYEQTKAFAHALAKVLEQREPDRVTSNMRKDQREGKVFVDWSQNDAHKSTLCVYSLRVTEEPRVSTPLTWEEVEQALKRQDPARLRFGPDEVLQRVTKLGDLHAPVATLKQKLPPLSPD
jgi:bifunctional non-homologous end joining protein LigD